MAISDIGSWNCSLLIPGIKSAVISSSCYNCFFMVIT
jgi:hypothetical protein